MKRLKIWTLAAFAAFAALGQAGLTGCKPNNVQPDPVVSISGVSPATVAPGSDITITGTQFGTTPADVTVTFAGGATATPKTVTGTSLTVTVPATAQSGPVSVKVGNKAAVTSTSTLTVQAAARQVVEVKGDLTASTTWSATKIYLLKGFVYVRSGTTLTIEPGTIIKGTGVADDPSGTGKGGTLIVERGAKIMAEGTADRPIVFTSAKAAGQRNYGDWGGLVLIGKAPHNRPGATTFEGGISGTYGTENEPNDNSGVLKFVRIEFGGIALSNTANSEINGLTLYGVGAGTTIENVQVSYSGDDAFEWFGGTVNAKRLVSYRTFDDDFDTDHGYTGKVQYAVALRDLEVADQSGSNFFESDNFSGDGTPATGPNAGMPLTAPVFANVSAFTFSGTPTTDKTARGSGSFQSAMHLRRNTSISIFNSVLVGMPEGLRLDNTSTWANADGGGLQLRGVTLGNVVMPYAGKNGISDDQAKTFFTTAAFKNEMYEAAKLSDLKLNANAFNLTGAAAFLPQAGSPLLSNTVWDGKGADAFFTKESFRGAFGTSNWLEKWTNFNPQQTEYN